MEMTGRVYHYWVALSWRVTGWAGQITSLRSLWFVQGTDLIKILSHHTAKTERAFSHLKTLFCVSQNGFLNPSLENTDRTKENQFLLKQGVGWSRGTEAGPVRKPSTSWPETIKKLLAFSSWVEWSSFLLVYKQFNVFIPYKITYSINIWGTSPKANHLGAGNYRGEQ